MTPVCRITAECIQRTAVEVWKYFVTVLVELLHDTLDQVVAAVATRWTNENIMSRYDGPGSRLHTQTTC